MEMGLGGQAGEGTEIELSSLKPVLRVVPPGRIQTCPLILRKALLLCPLAR